MIPTSFPQHSDIKRLTASMLIETKTVYFNAENPYILSSGLPSPVYVDCRRLISFVRVRKTLMDFLAIKILHDIGFEVFDNIAGGETAGIPFGVLIAERLGLPFCYVRKKPKGYGRNARIEGIIHDNQQVLLVEDMATDGGSKLDFVNALRATGAQCNHTAVIFFYDIFKSKKAKLEKANIHLHYLCSWWDILEEAKEKKIFDNKILSAVEQFLHDPHSWQDAHRSS